MPAGNLLHWAIVALVASEVCFRGIAGAAVDIARILFWVLLVIFLVVVVMSFMGRVRPAAAALGLSALLLAAGPAPAQPQRDTIFRDPSGRMTGRAEHRGDGTIFRDPSGRMTGRAEQRGDETIFRDPSGRMTGRAEQRSGGDIIYRDPSGRMTGRAERRGDETIFRDPSGRITGRAEAR